MKTPSSKDICISFPYGEVALSNIYYPTFPTLPSQNTADDQLSCGRVLVEECEGGKDTYEAKVYGLLVMVEVLWIQPELAGSSSEAVDLVKKAIALIQEAKVSFQIESFDKP